MNLELTVIPIERQLVIPRFDHGRRQDSVPLRGICENDVRQAHSACARLVQKCPDLEATTRIHASEETDMAMDVGQDGMAPGVMKRNVANLYDYLTGKPIWPA